MQKFFGNYIDGAPALGILIARVVFGAGLMMHGWGKIQAPFSWNKSGDVPGVLQALAALGEFGGGAGILLGFLTPLSCLGVLGTMFGAWWISHRGDPWINPGSRSFELASLYFAFALALIFTGPGRLALDALIWNRKKR
jgi:putative oxidoreductase